MFPIEFKFDWLATAIILIALGILFFLIRSKKRWYSFLRLAVSLMLLWLVLEPTVAFVPSSSSKPSLSVVVDVSRSMGIADPEQRLESVKKILQRSNDFLQENFDVSYFQFSQNSSRTSWKELSKIKPYGSQTNIAGAIQQVLLEKKQERSAILIFSDGTDNSPNNTLEEMQFETPVYAVGVGNAKSLMDIVVKDVRVSDFAFKSHPVEMTVKIQNFGFAGKTVPVILKEKKADTMDVIAMQNLSFGESSGESEVFFKFVPSAVGSLEYRVEVPVQSGEIAKQNNSIDFRLDVGREKIRVLYLCGQPSPEYAFIRQILKSDPSIELVSFVILRNPENIVPVPEDQLSLIPFPTHEIFVKTLTEFDLLIFENFSYSRFGILTSHLENIRQFVESRGGGFLMIGGENSFGLGGYRQTAIEGILPVYINAANEGVEDQPFTFHVLELQHSIFDLGESLKETQKFWNNMPRLNGYHKLFGIKPGATLLATVQESGQPAIAGWQRGKGRVLAMATLSTWQWALGLAERGLNQSGAVQFWRQVIRWLTTTGDSKSVRIVFSDSQFIVGKKSFIKLVLQTDKLKSSPNVEVQLNVTHQDKILQNLPLVTVGRFEYRAEWVPQMEGEITISATVKSGTLKYEDKRSVQVNFADIELENPYPDESILKEISQRSGGEYYHAKDFSATVLKDKIKTVQSPPREKVQKMLWTNPWLFAILICFLLLEWSLRRYKGEI